MNQSIYPTDINCTHPANDLIEAVAFGFASDDERKLVESHIAECHDCTQAMSEARFAAEALPLAAPESGMDRHESIWAGIEANIAAQPEVLQQEPLSSPSSPQRLPFRIHWAVAAVLALLTLAGGIFLGQMMFTDDSEPDRLVAQVEVTDPGIAATGTVHYDPDQGVLVLHMDDMPAAPEGFVYQVWVIDGETPVPVGTMDPNSSEFATSKSPTDFQTLAITVEQGPLGNELPTTEPIVVADLTQLIDD